MDEIILEFLNSQLLKTKELTLNSNEELLSSGLLDSLGMMRLIRFIERRFEIQIPFEDMTVENFNSVENITVYLSK